MKPFLCVVALALIFGIVSFRSSDLIPKPWELELIKKSHLPPPDSSVSVRYASEEYYNSLPEHVIYKTYPVYLREFEKPGYLDSLRQREPEVAFDLNKINSREDWIKAGEIVFNWPVASYRPIENKVSHLEKNHFQTKGKYTAEGLYPANRYIIREKGKIILGSLSCASCHSRIMESGEVVAGAQGNFFNSSGFIRDVESGRIPFPVLEQSFKQLFYTPWASGRIAIKPQNIDEAVQNLSAVPAGVVERQGTAYQRPVSIPSLIGIKDIKYLDHTGVMRHNSPGDMMRYAALNQGMDMLTSYNGYIPMGKNNNTELPSLKEWRHAFGYVAMRYSDAQLYALSQYIYSLVPPKNPNKFPKELVKEGEKIFKKAACVTCHTPPFFTNNKLTPVNGFEPPASHFREYDVFNVSVETDSVSALYSRRGTGYYKVPSLRGVWYRSAFFHNGNLATLEDIFDKRRLQADYVPSGYMPPHLKTMAVKGHPFGMDLNEKERKALVAYLKTL